ncbi:MAG: L-threonylcarbamoyladenylate synthase [Deltaproteobacteria bacterium]|nr:L-threonylcarbamoyladenylate synthase [Deltaproteobacteria bacterium]
MNLLTTRYLTVDPVFPDPDVIAQAARMLADGGLVAFPTETVYGLGARADREESVAKIYQAKGRPAHNPLITHVPDVAAARALVGEAWGPLHDQLAEAFWPGPLTLVVPRPAHIPAIVSAGLDALALRVPAHPVATALLRAAGVPVAAPSANRSSQLSPTRAAHVREGLDGRIDVLLDGGSCDVGLESTVLDLTQDPPVILRPGRITLQVLSAIVRDVKSHRALEIPQGISRPSPGLDSKHYAPRAALSVVTRQGLSQALASALRPVGVVTVGPWLAAPADVFLYTLADDAESYARALYETLHALDRKGCKSIVCEAIPEGEHWDAARDRLRRASA